jgi:hypothetical protein
MNWDAIGAIAELLGAIGVIASLVYLATQIRQSREQMERNTQALRGGSYQQFFQNIDAIAQRSSDNPEKERAVRLGRLDYNQLDEEDAFRFEVWITGMMLAWENAEYQHRVGMLDEDRRMLHLKQLKATLLLPGVTQWWRKSPMDVFSPEFVALVEEILGEEAEGADPTQ